MYVDIYNTKRKYNVIYADPPWSYKDKRNNHKNKRKCGGALSYYETMNIQDIKDLPIDRISEDNCMLFLWVTFPNLQEGLDTIKSWGFTYKTLGFSWIKTNKNNGKPCFGIGYYTRSNCEVCLIGVKGKPIKESGSVSSVVISQREEHSKKPDEVRDKIVELCGDVSRIELFARQNVEGWDCWGNEENIMEGEVELNKAILMHVELVPGDYVYIITDLKRKVVMKSKIRKVEIGENEIWYYVYDGVVKCAKDSNIEVGKYMSRLCCFCNAHINTGLVMSNKASGIVFTKKEKCLEFLRKHSDL